MPFTYTAPSGVISTGGSGSGSTTVVVNTDTNDSGREFLSSQTIPFDTTSVLSLTPPADTNLAECFAWAELVVTLDGSTNPDEATQQGRRVTGSFELESDQEVANFRFKGTANGGGGNLRVDYFKVAAAGLFNA